MAFFIGLGIVVLLILGLGAFGQRRRRGTYPWQLSRSPSGGSAERNATGSTVTGNLQNTQGPSNF
jgi:hypothetical protein